MSSAARRGLPSDAMMTGDEGDAGPVWWKRGILYQIYPRSFQDSDGDGVGDLPGIVDRLDYLQWLGVDAVWLSPVFPSPMADFGYDVADYTGIDPLFGTMTDFDRLVEEVHRRRLRVVLDLVPNHSSDEHPWFVESRSSRTSPQRDWYLWRDPVPDGGPPNNWLSVFGGSAWTLDETTGQYYYHAFLAEQPDLNWRNPAVGAAIHDAMRFWLDRGVDGFRVDVLWHLIKDAAFRDNPPNPDWTPDRPEYERLIPAYSTDQPEVHAVVAEMRRVIEEYEERVLIGEIYLPIDRLVRYYGEEGGGVHLPFNFQLLLLPWDARTIAAAVDRYEGALPAGAWPNWVLGNHDNSRIATRVGTAQARVAAMLLLTLRGTPTLYYGDEIGMEDVAIPPDQLRDPQAREGRSRDPERTPMQWTAGARAGFTTGQPWLPVADDYAEVNVETEQDDPDAMLGLVRRLIDVRRGSPALSTGGYRPCPAEGAILAYRRETGDERFAVVLNLSHRPARWPADAHRAGEVVIGTSRAREGDRIEGTVELNPDEGVTIRLET